MQSLVANLRIRQSSKLTLAASLLGLAMLAGGCFRSSMLPVGDCPDTDPECQSGTGGEAGSSGPHGGAIGGMGGRSAGGTGGGRVGGAGGGLTGGTGGRLTGGTGGRPTGGIGGGLTGGTGGSGVGGTGGRLAGGTGGSGVGGTGGRLTGGTGGSGVGGTGGRLTGGTGGRTTGGTGGGGVGGTGGRATGGSGGGGVGGTGGRITGGTGGGVVCGAREICDNGIDDDCNGLTDCYDPACQSLPICIDKKTEICNNGIDDNGNGLIDCKDPECYGDPACFVPGHEICNNGIDDNDNGLVDCQDPACFSDPTCIVHPGTEICNNGIDDNGDGLVDCADPQCKTFPACLSAACKADVDFGAIASSGASVTRTMSTVGATMTYSTCAPPGGVARVGSFNLPAAADVKLDFSQVKGSAHVVAVFRAGVGQPCDVQSNLVYCLAAGQDLTASYTFNGLSAGNYWIIVQSFTGTMGSTTVTLSTSKTTTPEICNNGIDDDGDGAIDCADLDCANAPNCQPCIPDINLGAIVVGDPPKTALVDTTKGSNRYHPTCAGTSTGKDIVVSFTVKDTVSILLKMSQPTGEHFYGLYQMPKAGDACDSDQDINCPSDPLPLLSETNWSYFTPGEYLLIFKAAAAGKEGQINLTISAWAGPGVELCNNGIDDDGNGLIDCADPACANASNCQAQMCLPDEDLGNFDIGSSQTLTVDLTKATRTFSTACGQGAGHGLLYRLNILQPMSLSVQATQTGNQVIQIASQVNPLDSCDAYHDDVDCSILGQPPLYGDFAFPNIQPGPHNLVVQAFASGSEGTVNLLLTGLSETFLEICNNGIDDDGDGATDCYDIKCAGDPTCEYLECKPAPVLGILPLDGTPTTAAVSTSVSSADKATSTCVSGKGGGEAAVSFTLTAKADLTIEWSQFGNHDLVLYHQINAHLPCEANTQLDCHTTADAATGSYSLPPGLAQGTYYLVVDADKPGSEGGVILQLSGFPSP